MCEDELFRPYRDAIERASESDRLWFEGHPDRVVRRRSPVRGEFGPFVEYSTIAFVHVDKIRDDTRLRSIIWRPRGLS